MASTFWPQFEMKTRQPESLQVFFCFKGDGADAGKFSGPDAKFVESVEKTTDGNYLVKLKVPVKHRIHPVGIVTEGGDARDARVVSVGRDAVEIVTSDEKGDPANAEIVHVTLGLFNSRLKH